MGTSLNEARRAQGIRIITDRIRSAMGGYYAHGVSQETATLPAGWRERLVPVRNQNTGGGTGLGLEIHDLAVSKLVAGPEKDVDFLSGLLRHRLVQVPVIQERLTKTALPVDRLQTCRARLDRLVNADGK